jgi:hypothetical protein
MSRGRRAGDLLATPALCRHTLRADGGTVAADLLLKRSLINRLELDFARDAARFEICSAFRE